MKGLKALQILENELKFYYQDEWNITRYPKDIAIIEKELIALEIIKQKLSVIGKYTFLPMSQEDFKLLMEVLNDECRTDD